MNRVDPTKFCKHYPGLARLFQTKGQCNAGLICREVTGGPGAGWLMRSPCVNLNEVETPCAKFEQYTAEELAQKKAEEEAFLKLAHNTLLLVSRLKSTNEPGDSGVIPCPECDGRLHYRIAQHNGHVHLKCETKNCITAME